MSDHTDAPGEFAISDEAKRLHDLRQPIAAILAAASALRTHSGLSESERDAFLKVIVHSAERLAGMLDEPEPPA